MRHIPDQWLQTVLMTMYKQPTTTRGEILRVTGLNPASLSHTLGHLISAGVVIRVGELDSKAGRPRDLLRLNPEAAYFVAIDLEASPVRFAITNFLGDIRYRWEEDVDRREATDVASIAKGVEMVCRALSKAEREVLLAIGISRPGVVDQQGRITSVNLGWRQFPLSKKLAGVLSLPIFEENTARAYVLAEHWQGRARDSQDCAYIEVGKGVGAGIVSGGKFFQGRTQVELGHLTIDPNATDLCKCGKTGCLEAIASSSNVVRQYLQKVRSLQAPATLAVGDIIERARRNDPHALAVIDRVARALGLGLSYLVAIFNPELFILGGYVIAAEDLILPRIRKELDSQVRDWMGAYELAVSNLGVDIGLKGGSSRAFYGVVSDGSLLRRLCRIDLPKVPLRKRASLLPS
jgi:predicted NBD/HSP70 family sugar kinase